MDWLTIFERFGALGIAIAYFCRKEVQCEAERILLQSKYEELLKDVIGQGEKISAKIDNLSDILQRTQEAS